MNISLQTTDLLYFIVFCDHVEVIHWPLEAWCWKSLVTILGRWIAVLISIRGFLYFPG